MYISILHLSRRHHWTLFGMQYWRQFLTSKPCYNQYWGSLWTLSPFFLGLKKKEKKNFSNIFCSLFCDFHNFHIYSVDCVDIFLCIHLFVSGASLETCQMGWCEFIRMLIAYGSVWFDSRGLTFKLSCEFGLHHQHLSNWWTPECIISWNIYRLSRFQSIVHDIID